MEYELIRTDGSHPGFLTLIKELDSSSGFEKINNYGHYRDIQESICLAKKLRDGVIKMENEKLIKEYWETFLNQGKNREIYADKAYESWHFCDNKKDADELAELVLKGIKSGTASQLSAYEKDKEPLPQTGEISIIIDWSSSPRCIIETIKIDRYHFAEVPSSFAATEGEGDGSLKYWRQAHIAAFSREAAELDIEFNDQSIVLCEEFEVIFPVPDKTTEKGGSK